MKYPALAVVAMMALSSCKPDEAKRLSALNAVNAASVKAEAAKIAASKASAPPAAAVDYAAALAKLEEAKRAAKDAGADQREIETRESLGRTEAAFEENKRTIAIAEGTAEMRRKLDADLTEIDRKYQARLREIEEGERQRKLDAIRLKQEEWNRKHGIEPDSPPAKPSSVPGLPPGMEPADRSRTLIETK